MKHAAAAIDVQTYFIPFAEMEAYFHFQYLKYRLIYRE
jgi:hypothetical protein